MVIIVHTFWQYLQSMTATITVLILIDMSSLYEIFAKLGLTILEHKISVIFDSGQKCPIPVFI